MEFKILTPTTPASAGKGGMTMEITQEEFDNILQDLVTENASTLLHIPGAYEVFSEFYNNEVIFRWETQWPPKKESEPTCTCPKNSNGIVMVLTHNCPEHGNP